MMKINVVRELRVKGVSTRWAFLPSKFVAVQKLQLLNLASVASSPNVLVVASNSVGHQIARSFLDCLASVALEIELLKVVPDLLEFFLGSVRWWHFVQTYASLLRILYAFSRFAASSGSSFAASSCHA